MIEPLNRSELIRIRPLWEKLNEIHLRDSVFFKEFYAHFSFEKRSEKWLEMPDDKLLILVVADRFDTITGYCVSTISPSNVGEVDSLFVESAFRNQGLGKQLLTQSVEWLKSRQCAPIRLSVSYGHESVIDFYNKLGFYPRLSVLELNDNP